jgi:acid phosphatase (class A)
MHCLVYLIEFLATNWQTSTQPGPPPPLAHTMQVEIPNLEAMKSRRPALMEDIKFHATSSFFSTLFPRRLMFNQHSHPATFEVMRAGNTIGRAVVIYYKDQFQRERPSRLSAEIDPVIDVPGHPAYPSGHATQAYLIAHLLQWVHPDGNDPTWQTEAFGVAKNVAEYREVAGVHYESDSAAGKTLAQNIFNILTDPQQCPEFHNLLTTARGEW